ncbi:hypothetical protein OC842_003647 [Tilletia horrida]|uniref:Uncharacterized protein n=1 Tax=Tilletia horrida TaxID=155126 RepID=A0AAN6GBB1_9BASI|nr:hypothetical protein OC842_003647 [Tilletia horrida]
MSKAASLANRHEDGARQIQPNSFAVFKSASSVGQPPYKKLEARLSRSSSSA